MGDETTQDTTAEQKPKKQAAAVVKIMQDKQRQVALQTTGVLDPIAYEHMRKLAGDFIAAGAATKDADTPEKLLMKLQAGHELGMKPAESLKALYLVNGAASFWGASFIGRLRLFGWSMKYTDETQEQCTATITHKDGTEYSETLTFEEAKLSGYTHYPATRGGGLKPGWLPGVNRKLKLRYGALSILAKTYIPEVLGTTNGIAEVEMDYEPTETEKMPARKAAAKQDGQNLTMGAMRVGEDDES